MKKLLLSLASLVLLAAGASAQPLVGTKTIPTDYPTVADAITALNANGVGAGGVIFDVPAGHLETAPAGGFVITASGNATDTIVFRKAGAGANPTFTAPNPQATGSINDAIFKLVGADYVTLDGFTMLENAANLVNTPSASNNMTEFGVAMFYAGATNGCQNNTIQNCTITLNRTYLNTFGIYSNTRHTATSMTVTAEATSPAGANSNNRFYGNAINNVNVGMVVVGTGSTANMDVGNDIGGGSVATGNTITNWGGGSPLSAYAGVTTSNFCVYSSNQLNNNISFNTVTSGAGLATTTIQHGGIITTYSTSPAAGTVTTSNLNNNTVTLINTPTTGQMTGITVQNITALATATINLNNNFVTGSVNGGTTAAFLGLFTAAGPGTMNVTGNTVRGVTSAVTGAGAVIGFQQQTNPVINALNINNNFFGDGVAGFVNFTVANSATVAGVVISSTAPGGTAATCAVSISNNDIRGITSVGASSGAHTYFNAGAPVLSTTMTGNTFTNLNINTTGNVTFLAAGGTASAGGFKLISNNSIVTAFNKAGSGGAVALYADGASSVSTAGVQNINNNFSNITVAGATTISGFFNNDGTGGTPLKTITGNTFNNWTCGTGAVVVLQSNFGNPASISNNTITNITGQGAITGLLTGSSGTVTALTIGSNTINNLSSTGTGGAVIGVSTASPNTTVSGNTINTLSSTSTAAAVSGVAVVTGGNSVTVSKNKIYDLSNSAAFTTAPGVNGILISTTTTSSTTTTVNNLIGDLRAPAANSNDAIRGINVSAAGTTATHNVYFNTVSLNASSSGTNFGTTGVFHSTSATATTGALNLRNNIISNTSTAAGTGLTVAYRRSSTTLTNYAAASNSNDFWAGTPSATNLIFADGTNTDQTMATYKPRVASRDSASFNEGPVFLSTAGASANFLHIDPTIATQIESGAAVISGITDDFDGNTRNGSTPDVGADEFAGIGIDLSPPVIAFTPLGNTLAGMNQTLTATITDASGVPTAGAGLPTLYFRINAGAYSAVTGVSIGGNQYTFTFGSGATTVGDVVSYYVVAQDGAGTPNIIAQPSAGAGGYTANPPAAATAPTTPNSYSIAPSFAGNRTVGAGGDFATLGAAIAGLNGGVVTGPVTLTLTDATYTETFPIVIPPLAGVSSTNTVTIKPATGVSTTFTGTSGADCVLTLNGADWIVVDGSNTVGGTTRNLSFVSANTGSAGVICLKSNGSNGATNNVVKNVVATGTSPTGTLIGLYSGGATVSITSAATGNNNNTFQNNDIRSTQYGIYSGGTSATAKNSGNVITQNVMNFANPNHGLGGILVRFESGIAITENRIANISAATVQGFGITLGLLPANTFTVFTGSESDGADVSRNIIDNVFRNGDGSVFGIGVATVTQAGSAPNVIRNNVVSRMRASAATPSDFAAGILLGGGAQGSTVVQYNSISMTGSGPATSPTFGIVIGGSNPVVQLRNNAFYDAVVPTGVGKIHAIGLAYGAPFTNLSSNYNAFFTVGSGTNNFFGVTGGLAGTDVATLAAWQTLTGGDANSIFVDPAYNSTSNLQPNLGSPLLLAGTPIGGVTTDILGVTRNASTPTIGAFENALDQAGPAIVYTVLANTTSTANRTLAFTATDASGVGTGANLPRIFYRKGSTDPFVSTQAVSGGGNNYTATIDYSLVTGGSVTGGDIIQYFVIAQDLLGNVSGNPSAGGVFTANPPGVTTPPTTPNSYRVAATIVGNYNVGTGETFTSLTNAGGFFEFVNANVVVGNVTVSITTDLTGEAGTVALNQWAEEGAGGYTMVVSPSGAARAITSTASAGAVIRLNGTDRITFDGSLSGGTDRSLSITNTNTATGTATILVGSPGIGVGANNVTIKNCLIRAGTVGSATVTTFGIFVGDATGAANGNDNDNLVIQNNQISRATIGIQALGATTGLNDNPQIVDNLIGDAVAANSIGRIGMNVGQSTGALISRNTVMNVITSSATITDTNNGRGIILSAGFVNSSVTRNTITGVRYTSNAGYGGKGMDIVTGVAASNLLIANNVISDIFGDGWNTFEGDSVVGMRVAGTTGGIRIYNNSVFLGSGATAGTTAGDLAAGNLSAALYLGASTTDLDIRNNIFATNVDNTNQTNDRSYAIATVATAPTIFTNINNNDYFVSGPAGLVGTLNAVDRADLVAWQTATTQDAASISGNPLFTSATDLHLLAASPAGNAGVVLAGVTVDIDGNTRSALKPDIGADELAPSASASNLTMSAGTLTPAFDTLTLAYTNTVANSVTDVTVTPTAADTNALIEVQVNGGGYSTVASGSPSGALALNIGSNTIDVRLTAEFGAPQLTYTVTVTRQAVLTAGTLNITVNQGYSRVITQAELLAVATFSPGFSPNVTSADAASAAGGTIGLAAGVSVTYNVPAAVFTGADSFSYLLTNSLGQTAIGSISITVVAPAFPPRAFTVVKTGPGTLSASYGGAVPNLRYRLQYSPNMTTTWVDLLDGLGNPVEAFADPSGNVSFTNAPAAGTKGFFRLFGDT